MLEDEDCGRVGGLEENKKNMRKQINIILSYLLCNYIF
jgi:hypothetical protein